MKARKHSRLSLGTIANQGKISLVLGLGIGIVVFWEFNQPAQAQTIEVSFAHKQQSLSTVKVIHINPNTGNDQKGNGTEQSPFKTITQALMLAKAKTVIVLAPGTYKTETGEHFPLEIKTEVTIQGNPRNQGRDVIIEGSGIFISPTSAGQRATIVATDKALAITGVTIINPHSQGYGLWIESANPEVTNNTFMRNGHAGISVHGNSRPLIAENYFYNNQGNGLVVYGTAQPQLYKNLFEKTGYGVSVLQDAVPVLRENHFLGNRIGIILQGNAQATLRNNKIEMSLEDGVVAISHARPDLGTPQQPGNNIFQRNRGLDIHNLSPQQTIPAFGNQISGRTAGKIDLTGTSQRIEPTIRSSQLLAEYNLAANNDSAADEDNKIARDLSAPPLKPLLLSPEEATGGEAASNSRKVPSLPRSAAVEGTGTLPPPPPTQGSVPIAIAPAATSMPSQQLSYPRAANPQTRKDLSDLLAVSPNLAPNINGQTNFTPDTISDKQESDYPTEVSQQPVSAYRVMAETLNKQQEQELFRVYPDAFRTTYNGQPMWQIGVFSTQQGATQALEKLNDLGLSGLVVQF